MVQGVPNSKKRSTLREVKSMRSRNDILVEATYRMASPPVSTEERMNVIDMNLAITHLLRI